MLKNGTLWKITTTLEKCMEIRDMINRTLPIECTVYLTDNEYRGKVRRLIDPKSAQYEEYVSGCTCDVCNRGISNKQKYYDVVTGHRGWSDDSVESRKHHQLCSEECLAAFVKSYNETETEDSRYMEIEHETMNFSELSDD